MGQGEILEVLFKANKPLRNEEIAQKVGIGSTSISHSTKRLRDSNEIGHLVKYEKVLLRKIPRTYYYMTGKMKEEYEE